MPSYGDLLLEEYGIVEEKFKVVGQGLKQICGPKANEGKKHIQAGNRYYRSKKYKDAKRCYNDAKDCYEEVIKAAEDIPNDSGWTWLWRLLPPATLFSIIQIGYSDGDMDAVTRSSTIGRLRSIIKHIDKHIKKCDESMAKMRERYEEYSDDKGVKESMSYYGDLFLEEYGIVEEFKSPLTFGQGLKVLTNDNANNAIRLIKSAHRYERSGEYKKAKKDYEQALVYYKKVRSEAENIDSDYMIDWIVQWVISPYIAIYKILYSNGNLKHATRDSALNHIDGIIEDVEDHIKQCENGGKI